MLKFWQISCYFHAGMWNGMLVSRQTAVCGIQLHLGPGHHGHTSLSDSSVWDTTTSGTRPPWTHQSVRQLCVGYNYIWDPATMDTPVCEMFVRMDEVVALQNSCMYLISRIKYYS